MLNKDTNFLTIQCTLFLNLRNHRNNFRNTSYVYNLVRKQIINSEQVKIYWILHFYTEQQLFVSNNHNDVITYNIKTRKFTVRKYNCFTVILNA